MLRKSFGGLSLFVFVFMFTAYPLIVVKTADASNNVVYDRGHTIYYTISKSLYCINRTLAHRLTVYATRRHKLKVYATISIRNGIICVLTAEEWLIR